MSDRIEIKSALGDYCVEFVDDVFRKLTNERADNTFYVIDSSVHALYQSQFASLAEDGCLIVEALETNKTYEYCGKVISELVGKKVKRSSTIVAVGGGIVQDISAFVSSILYRGIPWWFVPTTLLAQADSCIGGKTSINIGQTKNTVGNFNPPRKVFLDLQFLKSLSTADIKCGIGEMLHYFIYSNSRFTDKVVLDYAFLLTERERLKDFIRESLHIKKSVVEIDEFDKGERNKFNYGHTFGHALESVTEYAINHGQAVTVGMDIANSLSRRLGLMDDKTYASLRRCLQINFPDYDFHSIEIERYMSYLSRDKKNVDEELVCILSEGPGRLKKVKLPLDESLKQFLLSYFELSPVCSPS